MNPKYLFMIAASAAIILATSCSNGQDEVPTDVEIRLKATVDNMLVTRATAGIQGSSFDYIDAEHPNTINVEIIDAKVKADGTPAKKPDTPIRASYIFRTTATTGTDGGLVPTGTTPYFPNTGNKVNIYAYYPATVTGATTSFTVQTDQTTAAGYRASDLMYGEPASNPVAPTAAAVPLQFTHKLSKVIVRLQAEDGDELAASELANATVTMKAMASTPVSTTGEATPQNWASATASTINMGGMTVSPSNNAVYETAAVIVPQTIANASANVIAVTLPGIGTCYYTPQHELNIVAGHSHVFTFTLGLNQIRVTATMEPWESEAGESFSVVIDNMYLNINATMELWTQESSTSDSQLI